MNRIIAEPPFWQEATPWLDDWPVVLVLLVSRSIRLILEFAIRKVTRLNTWRTSALRSTIATPSKTMDPQVQLTLEVVHMIRHTLNG
jgi:hypothetical protein